MNTHYVQNHRKTGLSIPLSNARHLGVRVGLSGMTFKTEVLSQQALT